MTPIEQAKALHESENGPRSFREDLEAHFLHGMVFSTPTAFIMARYVSRYWAWDTIINPRINFGTDLTWPRDCLHIYLAAGDLTEFFTFPHDSPKWVSFERKNRLRFYPYATLRQRCTSTALTSRPI